MTALMNEKETYLAHFNDFEKEVGVRDRPALRRVRNAAIARFAELGFPTARNEDWKFTSVSALAQMPFRLAGPADVSAEALRPYTFADCTRLVFVNGHFAAGVSSPVDATAGSLAAALRERPDLAEPHLARHAKHDDQPFTALNTAFVQDGAFVYVPKGVVLEKPIHLLFLSTTSGEPAVAHPRNLVVVGAGAQVTVVESYVAPEDGIYFTNAVTEIVAGDSAVVDHVKLQRESVRAYHVATTQVHQGRASNFRTHYVGQGGALVRNEVRVVLDAEGCEATVNGVYLASGTQHMDNHTVIDHARPHCASHELYKGVLAGKAKGVFNGKIFVRPDAQKTDAKQTNQTLLLSDDATIDTKPQLEIYADDVKCTHGATVGNLDEDALFYLRARGIDLASARALLTYAFANDIVGRIKVESVRAALERQLQPGKDE